MTLFLTDLTRISNGLKLTSNGLLLLARVHVREPDAVRGDWWQLNFFLGRAHYVLFEI